MAPVHPSQALAFVRLQQEILAQALDTPLATKSDVAGINAKVDKLTWMVGILFALAVANLAKQFF